MDTFITLAALAAYFLLCVAVVAGLRARARVVKRHDERKRRLERQTFDARQAQAREELAQVTKHVAPVAAAGGLGQAEVDRMIEILKKPTAREPETAPTEPPDSAYRHAGEPCAVCGDIMPIEDCTTFIVGQPCHPACYRRQRAAWQRRPDPAPKPPARRSPPPAAHTWPVRSPVTHGSQPSVADRGDAPLTPWDAPSPPPPAIYDQSRYDSGSTYSSSDSGVTASGSWSDSSSSSSYDSSSSSSYDSSSGGSDASGGW